MGDERWAAGFSARLPRAGSPRRCNYYVSSGAYSPGVFNLVLFVSQRDPHFFPGEEREATPGLKLINQPGFTFGRPPAKGSYSATSLAAPGAPLSWSRFQARNVSGNPAKEPGIAQSMRTRLQMLSTPLALNFPPLQPSHAPKSGVGTLHLCWLVFLMKVPSPLVAKFWPHHVPNKWNCKIAGLIKSISHCNRNS